MNINYVVNKHIIKICMVSKEYKSHHMKLGMCPCVVTRWGSVGSGA